MRMGWGSAQQQSSHTHHTWNNVVKWLESTPTIVQQRAWLHCHGYQRAPWSPPTPEVGHHMLLWVGGYEVVRMRGCEGEVVRVWSYGGAGMRGGEDEEWKRNSIRHTHKSHVTPLRENMVHPETTQLDLQTFRSIQVLPWQLSQSASCSVGITSSCSLLVFPLCDVERSVVLQSIFLQSIAHSLTVLAVFPGMCHSSTHPGTSYHVAQFTRPSHALVLEVTNAGARRPGYEAIIIRWQWKT